MPELPEVEAARTLVEGHCLNKVVLRAVVADDNKVVEGVEPMDLQKLLEGATLLEARRKGKHMWVVLNRKPAVMFHFGMTGSMVVKGIAAAHYQNFVVDDEAWPPKYWKVHMDLEGDVQLAFSDARRFARVRVQEDPELHPPISQLGLDPLLSLPPLEEFRQLMGKQKRQIKAVLLDQHICAGVGNWVADEILFQARIHPEDRTNALTEEQQATLHHWLHEVPRVACEVGAESSKFPSSWLFSHRWSKTKKDTPHVEGGHAVEFATVAGRTTAMVPALQKRTTSDKAPAVRGKGQSRAQPSSGKKRRGNTAAQSSPGAEQSSDDTGEEAAGAIAEPDPADDAPRSKRSAKQAVKAALKVRPKRKADDKDGHQQAERPDAEPVEVPDTRAGRSRHQATRQTGAAGKSEPGTFAKFKHRAEDTAGEADAQPYAGQPAKRGRGRSKGKAAGKK